MLPSSEIPFHSSLAAFFYDLKDAEENALYGVQSELEARPRLLRDLQLPRFPYPPAEKKSLLVGLAIERLPRTPLGLWAASVESEEPIFFRGRITEGSPLRLFRLATSLAAEEEEEVGGWMEPWLEEEDPFPARLVLHSLLVGSKPEGERVPGEFYHVALAATEDLLAAERQAIRRHLPQVIGRGYGYLLRRLARLSPEEATEAMQGAEERQLAFLGAEDLLELMRHPDPELRQQSIRISGYSEQVGYAGAQSSPEGEARFFLLPLRQRGEEGRHPIFRAARLLLASERSVSLPWRGAEIES